MVLLCGPKIEDPTPRRHPAKPTQGRAKTRTARADQKRNAPARRGLLYFSQDFRGTTKAPREPDERQKNPGANPQSIARQSPTPSQVLHETRSHSEKKPENVRARVMDGETWRKTKIQAVAQQKCRKLEENDLNPSALGLRRLNPKP